MTRNEIVNKIAYEAYIIRKTALDMGYAAGEHGAHFSSTFSIAEIMATLFFGVMHYDPKRTDDPNRDRFVLSKGHGSLALYITLSEAGYFDKELLETFETKDSILPGHPSLHPELGIEYATGSLGHGLSLGAGAALAAKWDRLSYMTYVLCGDGECDEGSVWEAAMLAAKEHLDNLVVIIDCNRMQSDGFVKDVCEYGDMAAKWRAFGWNVKEVNGHDPLELYNALGENNYIWGKPLAIIAHTIKGKGVTLFENNPKTHHYRIKKDEYEVALAELECDENYRRSGYEG